MLRTLLCKIAPHQVDKHRVWHDGLNFRTRCARCGAELLRDDDGWREFEPDLDLQLPRSPHRDYHRPVESRDSVGSDRRSL